MFLEPSLVLTLNAIYFKGKFGNLCSLFTENSTYMIILCSISTFEIEGKDKREK